MVHILVRHKVEDFDSWKKLFDSAFEFRQSKGEKSYKIFRVVEDPNNVVGLFEWENPESAKEFFQSEELKGKMKEAGVAEEPDIWFLNEA